MPRGTPNAEYECVSVTRSSPQLGRRTPHYARTQRMPRTPTASSTARASSSSTCAGSTTWPGVPYFPLGSTFLGVAKVTEHPAVLAAATALDATPAQVGLA